MSTNRTRSWRRIAALRAAKRRRAEPPPPEARPDETRPLPPLESPDDDREFLPAWAWGGLRVQAD
jgi:hypothetical protein